MKIGIIGGGASGMMAAKGILDHCGTEDLSVVLFERNPKLGKKILVTGNGRCNLANESLDCSKYYVDDKERMGNWLSGFSTDDSLRLFAEMGLVTHNRNGYIYPLSDQASTVVSVMEAAIVNPAIDVKTNCFVKSIRCDKKGYWVSFACDEKEQELFFDKLIISCGGQAAPKTGSDGNGFLLLKQLGVEQTRTYPALCALKVKENTKALQGIRVYGSVSLYIDKQLIASDIGELQLTDYGISGIPVFQISRHASRALGLGKKVSVILDFFPDYDKKAWNSFVANQISLRKKYSREHQYDGLLNYKLMSYLGKLCKDDLTKVFELSRHFSFQVIETNSFEQAQVTCGGVLLSEITDDFELRRHKGVFVTGELLDVDGICGGYNLHFAWLSGYFAGRGAVSV